MVIMRDEISLLMIMAVPLLIHIIFKHPIKFALVESVIIGIIGLTALYLRERITAKYDFLIVQQARLRQELNEYAKQLERSNKLKDIFTDIMRHDMLNPITVIRGCAESLSEQKEMATIIKRNADRLREMIENASKYARLEEREELDFKETDLNVILKEAIENSRFLLDGKGMKVEYSAEGKCLAKTNPLIGDVFLNLISNAVKYSPEKSKIVVGLEDKNDEWEVMVKDYGVGIPDEHKEEIFERFKRGEKGSVKGTGLGLAIVRRIVNLHRGKVWVEDNPEGGSIFHVNVPKNPEAGSLAGKENNGRG